MRNRFLFVTLFLVLASSVASAQTLTTAKEYFDRAYKRADAGDQAGAMADYNSSITIKPDYSYALRGRGLLRKDQGDNTGAMADFNKLIAANPKDGLTYFDRGSLRNDLKDYAGAVEDFTNATIYNPSEKESYYNRALSYKAMGNYKAAIVDYDKYISLNTDNTRYLADGYYYRGIVKALLNDHAGAIADYTVASKLFPDDAIIYSSRAAAYRKLGKTALAIADETKAASLKK